MNPMETVVIVLGLESEHPFSRHLSQMKLLQDFQGKEDYSSQTQEVRLLPLARQAQSNLGVQDCQLHLSSARCSHSKFQGSILPQ